MAEVGLAMVRNALSHGVFRPQDRGTLDSIKVDLRRSETPFAILMLEAIERTEEAVARADFETAYREIRLIHNLPENQAAIATWDERWFYKVELPAYLEECGEPAIAKQVLKRIVDAGL